MAPRRRGQWSVLAVNGVTAVAVLVLVAVLALVVKPPAPPGIAAFAPQASKPITKAPLAQSARFGNGAGSCGGGQVCAGPGARPSASASLPPAGALPKPTLARGVPSALQCYTWPDGTVTQTFDPQSPPCIASWDDAKGNGGATSPGVTATEVKVTLPVNTTSSTWPTLKPLVDFVNTRYQLYGRKIRIVPFASQQADGQFKGKFNDPAAQRADASQIAALKPFASFDFVDPLHYSMSLPEFRSVLTKHRIISLAGGETTASGTEQDLERNAPYEWSYYPTLDTLARNVATMVCRQLAGHPAAHAGDAALHGKTRKFAIMLPTDTLMGGPVPGTSALRAILRGCGLGDVPLVRYDYAAGNSAALTANLRQLAADGVTSIIYLPLGGNQTNGPLSSATQVNYHPEWVVMGAHKYLADNMMNNPDQTVGAFGVGTWNKMPPLQQEEWVLAYGAAGGDQGAVNSGALTDGRAFYDELLVLAAGIQMAGPRLTPESFAAGLHATTFPNPGAGAAPTYQGTVGFGSRGAVMLDDLNAFWFTKEMTGAQVNNSTDNNTYRATCYVGLGRRFRLDTWPATDGFFQGGCR